MVPKFNILSGPQTEINFVFDLIFEFRSAATISPQTLHHSFTVICFTVRVFVLFCVQGFMCNERNTHVNSFGLHTTLIANAFVLNVGFPLNLVFLARDTNTEREKLCF